jgi:hypothetical protein
MFQADKRSSLVGDFTLGAWVGSGLAAAKRSAKPPSEKAAALEELSPSGRDAGFQKPALSEGDVCCAMVRVGSSLMAQLRE